MATFVKFGTTCPGVASSVETLVDACVGTLVDDVLGTGECPVRAARSVGRAGRGFMVCAAKGLAKPGSLNACNARQNTKLNTALSNAQRCVASSTASDLGAYCIMPLLNALPATVRCGTFLTTWASSAPVGAVAVDGSGNVYVADGVNNRIEKFDSTGTFLTAWGNGASGIAVDGSGNVYVTDLNAARVEKFDSTGTFLTAWGSIGSGPGQFQTAALHAIAVDGSGNV